MLITASGVIPVAVFPVLYPWITQKLPGLTESVLGISTACFFGVSTLVAPLSGRFVDFVGGRRTSRVVAAGSITVLVGLLLAPSPQLLVAVFAIAGLVQSLAITGSNLVMTHVLFGTWPAASFGVRQTAVPLLSMFAGIGASLLPRAIDWRIPFGIFGVLPVALLFLAPMTSTPVQTREIRLSFHAQAAPHVLTLLGAIGFFGGIAVSAFMTYAVISLTALEWSAGSAGGVVAVGSAAGITMRIASGIYVDHTRSRVFMITAALLVSGSVGGLFIASGKMALSAVGVLLAYGGGWAFPGLLQYAVTAAFPNRVGRTTGIVQIGTGIGITVGPLIFTMLRSRMNLGTAWIGIAISSLLAAGVAAWLGTRWEQRSADPRPHLARRTGNSLQAD